MERTLLEKCNADVFKAILDIKAKDAGVGERLIMILQKHQYPEQMTLEEINWFGAYLPSNLTPPIWNFRAHTFHLLFESQQTTVMP